jgi:hypothetical protein
VYCFCCITQVERDAGAASLRTELEVASKSLAEAVEGQRSAETALAEAARKAAVDERRLEVHTARCMILLRL